MREALDIRSKRDGAVACPLARASDDSPGRISVATQPAIPLSPVAASPVPRKRGIPPAEASVVISSAVVKRNSLLVLLTNGRVCVTIVPETRERALSQLRQEAGTVFPLPSLWPLRRRRPACRSQSDLCKPHPVHRPTGGPPRQQLRELRGAFQYGSSTTNYWKILEKSPLFLFKESMVERSSRSGFARADERAGQNHEGHEEHEGRIGDLRFWRRKETADERGGEHFGFGG